MLTTLARRWVTSGNRVYSRQIPRSEGTDAAKGLPMRILQELLRLRWGQGCSAREVARACQLSHSTVLEYEKTCL